MRRMNYPRFDKPTYVGTFNNDPAQLSFVMNDILKPGYYFVIIKDPESLQQYSCTFTIDTGTNSSCSWYSIAATQQIYLDYSPDYRNIISINSSNGNPDPVYEGATIELYKLN